MEKTNEYGKFQKYLDKCAKIIYRCICNYLCTMRSLHWCRCYKMPSYLSDYDSNKEGFAKTKILCVDEPFAELVGDKYKDMQLQLAIGEDNNMYIVGLNPKNDFPVVSKKYDR